MMVDQVDCHEKVVGTVVVREFDIGDALMLVKVRQTRLASAKAKISTGVERGWRSGRKAV